MKAPSPRAALAEVASFLDDRLAIHTFDEPESNGLMVDGSKEVSHVAAAVSTSFFAIEQAAAAGAQLLLTHHPSWDRFDLTNRSKKLARLRELGLAHYAAHSSLDGAPEISNSDGLARALGVQVERRFLDYCGGKAGVIGRAEGTFAALVERAVENLGLPVESWQNASSFGVVAVASGRADSPSAIAEAQAAGAQTYVTGEGSMWTKLYAREAGVDLIFGSHYATETFGVRSLAQLLQERFGLGWTFIPEQEGIR